MWTIKNWNLKADFYFGFFSRWHSVDIIQSNKPINQPEYFYFLFLIFKSTGTLSHEQRVANIIVLHMVLLLLPSTEPKPDLNPRPTAGGEVAHAGGEETPVESLLSALTSWLQRPPEHHLRENWLLIWTYLPVPSSAMGKGRPATRGYRGGAGSDNSILTKCFPGRSENKSRSSGSHRHLFQPFTTPLSTAGDQVAPDQMEYLTHPS